MQVSVRQTIWKKIVLHLIDNSYYGEEFSTKIKKNKNDNCIISWGNNREENNICHVLCHFNLISRTYFMREAPWNTLLYLELGMVKMIKMLLDDYKDNKEVKCTITKKTWNQGLKCNLSQVWFKFDTMA